jgi:sensor histidine kinase YesM
MSTPFLFCVLIKEKRWAWIIIFVVMVVLPCLFYYSISFGYIFTIFGMTVMMIPFYLYFLLLRYTVSEWLAEYEGQEMRKERKREEARRLKEEEEWM